MDLQIWKAVEIHTLECKLCPVGFHLVTLVKFTLKLLNIQTQIYCFYKTLIIFFIMFKLISNALYQKKLHKPSNCRLSIFFKSDVLAQYIHCFLLVILFALNRFICCANNLGQHSAVIFILIIPSCLYLGAQWCPWPFNQLPRFSIWKSAHTEAQWLHSYSHRR